MQRLSSTFAEGWSVAGLLLQRVLTSTLLTYCSPLHVLEEKGLGQSLPDLIAVVGGVFLLLGLWTPAAGIVITTVGGWAFLASRRIRRWQSHWLPLASPSLR